MPYHLDRKSTRLNSSHGSISYAVFCLKKKNNIKALLPTSSLHRPCRPAHTRAASAVLVTAQSQVHRLGPLGVCRSVYFFFFFNDRAPTEIPPFPPPPPFPF